MPPLPITPVTLPTELTGEQNGSIPPAKLIQTLVPGVKMISPAARALDALASALSSLGYVLRTVGGYRDLLGQWRIFGGSQARYRPVDSTLYVSTPANRRKLWPDAARADVATRLGINIPNSKYWVKIQYDNGGYPATAAVPGTSNHGWAIAVDLAEEYDADTTPDPIRPELVSWLVDHAGEYGYSAESQAEEWHWRYFAGDAIPQAVLAFENGAALPDYPRATLRLGSAGPEVRKFQHHYNFWNCEGFAPLLEDGSFGPKTDTAMRAFQRGLDVKDDGIYGPVTERHYLAVLLNLQVK